MLNLDPQPSRRVFLRRAAALAAARCGRLAASPARATQEAMRQAIRAVLGEAEARPGKVDARYPGAGRERQCGAADRVGRKPDVAGGPCQGDPRLQRKEPAAAVISVALGPRAGRAGVATRIKLADSQQVVAIAEMSDGSFWSGSAEVIVTLAACAEDLQ